MGLSEFIWQEIYYTIINFMFCKLQLIALFWLRHAGNFVPYFLCFHCFINSYLCPCDIFCIKGKEEHPVGPSLPSFELKSIIYQDICMPLFSTGLVYEIYWEFQLKFCSFYYYYFLFFSPCLWFQVETILDKDNFTLDELLDEDEIIQECKALNSRLINL